MTIPQAFQIALQHHQSGRLAEAEAIYRQILAVEPRHADALHLQGVIAQQMGRNDVAVDLIGRAIALAPNAPVFHSNLGEAYRKLGRLEEAIAAYRRAIELQPDFVEAHGNLANTLQDQGRLDEAITAYRRAIQFKPDFAEAHGNLGNALRNQGRLDEAIAAYGRAVQLKPHFAEALNNLGSSLRDQGRLDEAIAVYRRAIQHQPHFAEAHSNLGSALRDQGRLDAAVAAHRRAIELQPDCAEAHSNLGNALTSQGQLDEAIAACRQAIHLKPACAEAHSNLGHALAQQGRIEAAIAAYHQALQLKPDLVETHNNLGNALKEQGRLDEAIAAYHRALQIKPGCAEVHNNLGSALTDQGRLEAAIAAYRRAIELQPGYAEAHSNLGNTLKDQGRFEEALAACYRALQLEPDCQGANLNASLLLLRQGDFERGWPMYEARWDTGDLKRSKRNFPQPMWQGEMLHGQRVLIHAEQGLGDTLQFIRYAPLVAQRGGQVIVECQPGLKTLLASVEGVLQIIEQGEPLPAFDLHCPLMSLPLAFDTRLETIPANIPYLRADPQKVTRWRQRLERETDPAAAADLSIPSPPSPHAPLKVGLVWAGGDRPQQPNLRPVNQRRSLRLGQFAPLAAVPGVVFVSLQKGGPATEAKTPPAGMRFVDWTGELEDFADTAALIEALDLVISVDTAVAHLAGALGKPVWLLNRFDTCWRWLREREDSPWYPTMRLFRQPRYLDWEPVIARVREQLAQLATEKSPSS